MKSNEIGITLILLGTLLTIIGSILITLIPYSISDSSSAKTNTKIFVGGFFGPIPFGFSNSKYFLTAGLILVIIIYIILVTIYK